MPVYKVGKVCEKSCVWLESASCNPDASGAKPPKTESRCFGMSILAASITQQVVLYGQTLNSN
ncbi:hypothetical protein DDZ16_17360 [Marinilabilia rubra]|uniref:Uncharacterized protein n=1 Tax=Marinilabilia rubra TaxID=2162893 RepID=A0A2U2B4W6_9BACT|nr:hypothetical protein DDZ16_17360 [Marinilabilia rubra]